MAEPITNLTASWIDGTGVQLNWTAAADATTGSFYSVFVLTNVSSIIPSWLPAITLNASVIYQTSTASYTLIPPNEEYLFTWTQYQSLLAEGLVNKNSLSFSIIHTDSTGAESTATNISSYPKQMTTPSAPPHLRQVQNSQFDGYGQFLVYTQNSDEEIIESVSMFLGTVQGQRTAVPAYGVEDIPFSQINGSTIAYQSSKWEPRANVSIDVIYDSQNNAKLNVRVNSTSGGS
jgi:hypothetical protein